MQLNSPELFHFTKYEFLKSIIENQGFFPRYNLEFTHLSDNYPRRAALMPIPMVCFCDIPLDFSKNHRNRYGNTGIVLSEKWKLDNGLNPIFYIQKFSHLAEILASLNNITDSAILLKPIISESNTNKKIVLADNLRYLSYFLKQFENKEEVAIEYEGKLRIFEKRKFYEEREWRYIPFEADENDELFITIWDYDNETKLSASNKLMEKYKLKFNFTDIKFLIVENELQKKDILNLIEEIDKSVKIEIKVFKI
jgi:hypothetical protein